MSYVYFTSPIFGSETVKICIKPSFMKTSQTITYVRTVVKSSFIKSFLFDTLKCLGQKVDTKSRVILNFVTLFFYLNITCLLF